MQALPILSGIPSIFIIDAVGLRSSIWLGGLMNAVGSIGKAISTLPIFKSAAFTNSVVGDVIIALAKPFICFIPTYVSSAWFPTRERPIATALGSLSYLIGIIFTKIFLWNPPYPDRRAADITKLNNIWCGISVASFLIALVAVRSSRPPSPPSDTGRAVVPLSIKSIVKSFANKSLSTISLCVACQLAFFIYLVIDLELVLCLRGYEWSMNLITLLGFLISGIVASCSAGILVAKNKDVNHVRKLLVGAMCISISFLPLTMLTERYTFGITIICIIIGLVGFPAFTLGLHLSDECSYTFLPEYASMGVILLLSQVFIIVYRGIFEGLSKPILHVNASNCPTNALVYKPYDLTNPFLCIAGLQALSSILFIVFFETDFKRSRIEMVARLQRILNIRRSVEI
ncbi:solute carrier family 49 member A3-like isoform X2 [Ornithodoros turicata]